MRSVDSITVTKELLNPVGTLAAPRMLAAARRVSLASLPEEEQKIFVSRFIVASLRKAHEKESKYAFLLTRRKAHCLVTTLSMFSSAKVATQRVE